MRRTIACLSLVALVLAAGCGGGGVEADMQKSGDELRKEAAGMSVEELEKKMDEIEKYAKEVEAAHGDGEPSQADVEKASKLMEVTGIFGAELMKRKMK
ncbi:MAG: hypothetical protein L6Q95_11695 [Planctomycetes bacterium]|nr:hypothetical protein [Planctomycetota bacterium]